MTRQSGCFKVSCRIHAASLYREFLKSLDASDFARIYVKRRIREIEADAEVDAYRLVMGLGVVGSGSKRPTVNGKAGSLYCVIDLSGGANARAYPVAYLDRPPSGGFNTNEYKTRKLVLRRVDPGAFILGEDQSDESRRIRITKPFYMGVYLTTQKQWELVMNSNPSMYKGEINPVERVTYNGIRGSSMCGSGVVIGSAVRLRAATPLVRHRVELGIFAAKLRRIVGVREAYLILTAH